MRWVGKAVYDIVARQRYLVTRMQAIFVHDKALSLNITILLPFLNATHLHPFINSLGTINH